MKKIVTISALALLALTGCKPDAAIRSGNVVGAGPRETQELENSPATQGAITGTVRVTGKVPARVPIDMSQDPACSLGGKNLSEQYMVQDGRVANVFVYLKDAPKVKMTATAPLPVTIDQKGCRFSPHVAAIMKGGSVVFTNSDPTMHNVHAMPVQVGNRSADVSQGPGGKPEEMHFRNAETMLPIRCNNHPWMNAFLNISPTQFFAVTGPSGTFQISGVPEGKYTVVVVHEKLGTREIPLVVTAQKAVEANATFNVK